MYKVLNTPKRPLFFLKIIIILIIPLALKSQECEKVKIADFPENDLPPSFESIRLQKETSYKYYYGIGVNVDYTKARHLAFTEAKAEEYADDPFAGYSILLMLYANGFGVQRNLDLSIRIACANVNGAPAEIEGRIQHLRDLKSKQPGEIFDICDDITSGYMMGMCQSVQSEIAEVKRKLRIDSVIKKWPQKDQIAYDTLRKAASSFFENRSVFEVDLSGTARALFEIGESDALEDNFQGEILKADQCAFKKYAVSDFLNADKKLNSLYTKIMTAKNTQWGTITKKGIKSTQKKWILYRDAWVIFGKIRCPGITNNALKTLLTKERILQLRDLIDQLNLNNTDNQRHIFER